MVELPSLHSGADASFSAAAANAAAAVATATAQAGEQVPVDGRQQRQPREQARERHLQAISAVDHERQVACHPRMAHALRI